MFSSPPSCTKVTTSGARSQSKVLMQPNRSCRELSDCTLSLHFSPRSLFFCSLNSLFFSCGIYLGHVLRLSKAPLASELGKDAFLLNLERVVCGRNCRKTAFSSPLSFSRPPHECCCSPRFSQALSLLYFHGVKEAAGSLGFTCL